MSNRPEESSESRQTAVTGNSVDGNFTIESIKQYIINIVIGNNRQSDNLNDPQKLQKFLNKQKSEIEKSLETWVYKNNQIDLEKEKRPRFVDSELAKNSSISPPDRRQEPPGTRMIDIFDGALKKLLILGKPGAGKTYALWQLASELINRTENKINDPDFLDEPIPILLNLTTWKTSQSIKEWIIEQLKSKGIKSKKLGRKWFEDKKLLPLLDEFDLLSTNDQEECIKAINKLLQEEDQLDGLVVCSRLDEYDQIHNDKVRFKFEEAICLKPLTKSQVSGYFKLIEHEELWESIQEDSDLLKIFESPLFLRIFVKILVEQEASTEKQQEIIKELRECESGEELRDGFFDFYIEDMLAQKPSLKDAKKRLIQLAKIMSEKQQLLTEFLIEDMQPSRWFSEDEEKAYNLIVRLVVGLTAGLTAGLYLWGWSHQPTILLLAILTGVVTGAIFYLFTSLINSFSKSVSRLLSGILPGLIFFVLMYSLGSLTSIYLENGNFFMLLTGIGVGVVFYGLSSPQIEAVDKLEFDYSRAVRYSCFALLLGIFFVPIHFWIEPELYTNNPAYGVYELFSIFLVGLSMGAILGKETKIDLNLKHDPNQGIWKSRNYSVRYFVIGGSIAGILTVLMDGFQIIRTTGIVSTVGLFISLIGGGYSGLVCIRHFILRVMLYLNRDKYVPWDYAGFLEDAFEIRLLQKVGGRYKFWHGLLQEHFAKMTFENEED